MSEAIAEKQDTKQIKKKSKGFAIYIAKVLKSVHPDASISTKAVTQLNDFLHVIALGLSEQAHVLAKNNGRLTVTGREIEVVIDTTFDKTLFNSAKSEGTRAITEWEASFETKEDKTNPISGQQRAKLILPVSRVENLLRKFGGSDSRVGKKAPVYLAGVLECILTGVLENAGNVAKTMDRVKVISRHILFAIHDDPSLLNLCKVFNIEFGGAGIIPFVHAELLNKDKKKKRKKEKNEKGTKKPHKYLPGTVSVREINKEQKGTNLLIQKAAFKREFRKIAQENLKDIRFSEDVIESVQDFTELRLIKVFQGAQQRAIAAKREGIQAKDIQEAALACLLPTLNKTGEPVELKEKSLEHVARRGGVKRISKEVYAEIRQNVAPRIMYSLANNLVHITEYNKAKTSSMKMLKQTFAGIKYNFIP